MWYTYVDHPQAIKLIEWMTQQDIDRVQEHILEQEHMTNIYKDIIDVRRKQLSIKRSEANIKARMNTVKHNNNKA